MKIERRMGIEKIGILVVATCLLCVLSHAEEIAPLLHRVNNWQMTHPV